MATYISYDEYGNEYKLEFGNAANMGRAANPNKGNHYRLTITSEDGTDKVESTGTVTDVTDITAENVSITRKRINLKHKSNAEIDAIVFNDTGEITSFYGNNKRIPTDGGEIPMPEGFLYAPWRGGYMLIDGKAITDENGIANIPATFRNRPVTAIGEAAFMNHEVVYKEGGMMGGYYQILYNTDLKSVTIPAGVTSIDHLAFFYCTNLTSINIPAGVTSIGHGTFFGCASLTSITIPAGVTVIGNGTFSDCTSLTSITIPTGVTSISEWAFGGCTSLTSVTFALNSKLETIGHMAFDQCSSLTNIIIPASVTSIGIPIPLVNRGGVFNSCANLTTVTFAEGSRLEFIGETAFGNCRNLTSITIPASVTSIGEAAFINCKSLTNITIPASVTSIGEEAFAGCTDLTSITVDGNNPNYASESGILYNKAKTTLIQAPAGISGDIAIPTDVTSISELAFCLCTSLTSVTIPNSVTKVGRSAFFNWAASQTINIQGKSEAQAKTAWGEDWLLDCNATINYNP